MKANKLELAWIYVAATIAGVVFWIPNPDAVHFLGSSASMSYLLLLAVTREYRWIGIVLFILCISFVAGFVYSVVQLIKGKSKPVLVIACADLIVSIGAIVYKIIANLSDDLFPFVFGLVLRSIYCVLMYIVNQKATQLSDDT